MALVFSARSEFWNLKIKSLTIWSEEVLHKVRQPKVLINQTPDHVWTCFLHQSDMTDFIKPTELSELSKSRTKITKSTNIASCGKTGPSDLSRPASVASIMQDRNIEVGWASQCVGLQSHTVVKINLTALRQSYARARPDTIISIYSDF